MEIKFKHLVLASALMLVAIAPAGAAVQQDYSAKVPWPIALRETQLRIARVGYFVKRKAATLCPRQGSGTGLTIDYIGAYPVRDQTAVSALLQLSGNPQIAGVVAGSPADQAGARAGDQILAIDGTTNAILITQMPNKTLLADRIEEVLEEKPADRPIILQIARNGVEMDLVVHPIPTCSARLVMKTAKSIEAYGDGKNVGVSTSLAQFAETDDELALVIGHEIAHIINRDGKATGIDDRRAKEDRADLLGAGLLRCAGYDVERSTRFLSRYNRRDWLRMFKSPSHRRPSSRIDLILSHARDTQCPPTAGLAVGPG